MAKGVKLTRELLATEPLASYVTGELWPGPDVTSDGQLVEPLQGQERGHHLGGGGHRPGRGRVALEQHLPGGLVGEDGRPGLHPRRGHHPRPGDRGSGGDDGRMLRRMHVV